MKCEATLDGVEMAELADGRLGRAGLRVSFELIKAQGRVAGRTDHFALRAREAMRGPVLAHDFGGASAAFAFRQVLIDVLKCAVGSDMTSKQVTLAFVVATLVFVRAADTERVDHVFDEERGGLEISELERGPAGGASSRRCCGYEWIDIIFCCVLRGERRCNTLLAKGMRAYIRSVRLEERTQADGTVEKSTDACIVVDIVEAVARGPRKLLDAAADVGGVGSLADGRGCSGLKRS